MSEIGLLVKVPAELHSTFKRASAKHQRSMQKVMVALLEGWIANGAPDPLSYGSSQDQAEQSSIQDSGARQALLQVAAEIKDLKQRVARLEKGKPDKPKQSLDFDAFFEALGQAATSETDPEGKELDIAPLGEEARHAAKTQKARRAQ